METLFLRIRCPEPLPFLADLKSQLPPWQRRQHWLRDGGENTNYGHAHKKPRNRRGKRYYNPRKQSQSRRGWR